jgi:hypothetical protein
MAAPVSDPPATAAAAAVAPAGRAGRAAPPLPRWRTWGARASLGLVAAAIVWLFARGPGGAHDVRLLYILGDRAAVLSTVSATLVDGERVVRTKEWTFSAAAPAARTLEDSIEVAPGPYALILDWTGSAGAGSRRYDILVTDDPPAAPVVLALEPAPAER